LCSPLAALREEEEEEEAEEEEEVELALDSAENHMY
jgi:hypothetical protein